MYKRLKKAFEESLKELKKSYDQHPNWTMFFAFATWAYIFYQVGEPERKLERSRLARRRRQEWIDSLPANHNYNLDEITEEDFYY